MSAITLPDAAIGQRMAAVTAEMKSKNPLVAQRDAEVSDLAIPDMLLQKNATQKWAVLLAKTGSISAVIETLTNEQLRQLDQFTGQLMTYGRRNPTEIQDWALVSHGNASRRSITDRYPNIDAEEIPEDEMEAWLNTVRAHVHVEYPKHQIGLDIHLTGCMMIGSIVPRRNYITRFHQNAIEANLYATICYGAKNLGLGGVSGAATHGGASVKVVLELIKHQLLSRFSEAEIRIALPALLDAKVTSGHTTTVAAILDQIKHYHAIDPRRAKRPVAIQGVGAIGGAVARCLNEVHPEIELILIEKNQHRAESIAQTLNGTIHLVPATEMNDHLSLLSEAGCWVLATSGAFDLESFKGIMEAARKRNANPAIIDDTWPHVLHELKATLEGIAMTEVAYHIPQNLTTNFDRRVGHRVSKPLLNSGEGEIAYSCEIESMILALLQRIDDSAIRSLSESSDTPEVQFNTLKLMQAEGLTGEVTWANVKAMRQLLAALKMNNVKSHFAGRLLPAYDL